MATWFGSGKIGKAPGTMGTIAALPIALILHSGGSLLQMGFSVFFLPFSIWICEMYERAGHTHDSKEVVIDEVLGFVISVTWLPLTWQTYLYGFLLFRFFDILKPFPISLIDKKVKGGVGVVADDVVAGVFANLILQTLFVKTSLLGSQLIM